jgi:hypothetical protein
MAPAVPVADAIGIPQYRPAFLADEEYSPEVSNPRSAPVSIHVPSHSLPTRMWRFRNSSRLSHGPLLRRYHGAPGAREVGALIRRPARADICRGIGRSMVEDEIPGVGAPRHVDLDWRSIGR